MRRRLTLALAGALLLSGCAALPTTGTSTSANVVSSVEHPDVARYVPAPSLSSPPPAPAKVAVKPAATATSILDDLMFDNLQSDYRAAGMSLDRSSYKLLRDDICKDMQTGGEGYFTIGDVSAVPDATQQHLARSAWLIFALSCFPDDYVHSDADIDAIADSMVEDLPEYQRRLAAAGLSLAGDEETIASYGSGASGSGYSGSGLYGSGGGPSGSGSSGYTAMCNDGTVSQSGGKRGACSWHGGVSK
ncbi:hypothetical protein QF047_002551 [Arthrobacter sp. W4I7]|nr:hypothetical protein [Arthrobacter sp. W4I7]